MAGRPTSYTPEVIAEAEQYLVDYREKHGQVIPSVVGLCKVINRGKTTVYNWIDDKSDVYQVEFRDIVDKILEYQEIDLVSGGLSNAYNASISKLLLTKHGYSDKQETEHRGAMEIVTVPFLTAPKDD